jgi:hypothetical protein
MNVDFEKRWDPVPVVMRESEPAVVVPVRSGGILYDHRRLMRTPVRRLRAALRDVGRMDGAALMKAYRSSRSRDRGRWGGRDIARRRRFDAPPPWSRQMQHRGEGQIRRQMP